MPASVPPATRRALVVELLRMLRRLDEQIGVKHSGIALDVGMLLYERGGPGLPVREITAATGYSGPTVRLVLARLTEAGAVEASGRDGRAQVIALTARGLAGFEAYVETVWSFVVRAAAGLGNGANGAATFSPAAAPGPLPDPPGGRQHPPGRRARGRPRRQVLASRGA